MLSEKYKNIGRLKKTYGNEGAIRFILFEGYEEDIESASHFFVYLDGIYVPFFFDKSAFKNNVFKLKGIDTLKKTEELVSQPIFLSVDQIISEPQPLELLKYSFLTGFTLLNQDNKNLGKIANIEAFPMQEIAKLEDGTMIPINDLLIQEVNKEEKIVKMEIIEGLLGL